MSIEQALKTRQPKDIVKAFLENTAKDKVENAANQLVDINATYV